MPSPSVRRTPTPTVRCATVADLMRPRVVGCTRRTTLRAMAELMLDERTHALVVDSRPAAEGRPAAPWALLSAFDLSAAVGQDADRTTADALATRPAVTAVPDAPVADAARLMREHGVAHLLVVHPQSGLPLGVLSAFDLMRSIAWGRS